VEIVGGLDPRVIWLLENPAPMESHRAFREQTRSLLRKDWTHLLAIAETGEWLSEPDIVKVFQSRPRANRQVLLVEASYDGLQAGFRVDVERDVEMARRRLRRLKRPISVHSASVPWWDHNRHLTVACRIGEGGVVNFLGGIYFRRRLQASQISPVFVTEPHDCICLSRIFLSYVKRAAERWLSEAAELILNKRPGGVSFIKAGPELLRIMEGLTSMKVARDHSYRWDTHIDSIREVARLVGERLAELKPSSPAPAVVGDGAAVVESKPIKAHQKAKAL